MSSPTTSTPASSQVLSELSCPPVFTVFTTLRPGIARAKCAALRRTDGSRFHLAGPGLWSGARSNKKEMQLFFSLEYLRMGTSACWNEPCGSDKRLLPLPFFFSFFPYSIQRLLLFFSGHMYIFITFVEKVVCSAGISGYYVKGQDGHFLCLVFFLWPHQSELYLTV